MTTHAIELFDASDARWIAAVLDIVETCLGRPWRMLLERLDDAPPRDVRKPGRASVAAILRALRFVVGGRAERSRIARAARAQVLGTPALDREARDARLLVAASGLGISPEDVENILWADLAMERPVLLPRGRPAERELAGFANLERIQQALRRAHEAELRVWDGAHALIRTAKRYGLLATISRGGAGETVVRVTGPLSLFHATTIYGNALAALVPLLADLRRFTLDVRCDLRTGERHLRVGSPLLLPSEPFPRRPGARLDLRLARDLEAAGCVVGREPEPLAAGEHLLFPELVVDHAGVRAYVEIVGFSTEAYLVHRLAQYREAGVGAVVLCVDAARAGDPEGGDPHVLRYDRKKGRTPPVDPAAILAAVEAL